MKIMKYVRYPLLFLLIILVPPSLAAIFMELPLPGTIPGFISPVVGFLAGYVLIYGFATINKAFYSKRMRTTYLIVNAVTALLLFGMLAYSVTLLFSGQIFTAVHAVLFIGFPWISVQMLLLLFFVRSESLYR